MSFLAPFAAPAISAAVNVGGGLLASKLAGGKSGSQTLASFAPSGGFSGGGLKGSFNDNGIFRVGSTPERKSLVGNLAATFPEQAQKIASLRRLVAPGYGALTQSRLAQVGDARRKAVGDLKDNLQRRRVLGSSFGQDAIARAEAEFGRQADQVVTESFLQELDLTNQLINQEFDARRGEFQTGLDELNLQAELAGKFAGEATTQLGANARLKAQLAASEAAGSGKFFGQALQPSLDAISSKVGSMFSGSTALPWADTAGSGAALGYGGLTA